MYSPHTFCGDGIWLYFVFPKAEISTRGLFLKAGNYVLAFPFFNCMMYLQVIKPRDPGRLALHCFYSGQKLLFSNH